MKGLAFAVSLFHRLTAEDPSKPVEAIVSDVESFAARLVVAGKVVEAAFADAEPTRPLAGVVSGEHIDDAAVRKVFERSAEAVNDQVRAIVGGASTPTGADSVSIGGATVAGASTPDEPGVVQKFMSDLGGPGPAPTPPAPGIGGLPPGK